ncbi:MULTISPECIES: TetR/AcrR family transcriptional regulator [Streptomyces]|uniref:TetR/AcrR family transcriptional regulator n=1 Tax=Streptomyces TaxID=1883 RepID=UPI00163C1CC9|nr:MULTISPECIES: TetR family transcriptional regulator C-terminal domain-containing protein [Streptomyces]MBC2876395.1 TetR/AcrR family transcriptional regulator [Streptomyces sp. TYQ1024]UBI35389.1 TetR family transcriptional regulator C-terminal domain-containing protein [Streptomyces mobaraensis]UKW27981.1 TetR family transcriptional regulator C-terminal domain-containing protein [Streptomyces sp. TYQ1024]
MATARRILIADAALDVLADEGMRGLTHRAVDRAANLPPGTTSAYFRTRRSLLDALVRRLVDLDQTELRTLGAAFPVPRNADELTSGLAAFTALRLTGPGRRRTLARYACAVESVRDPALREVLAPRENPARDAVRDFLAAHGVPDPEERTVTLLACVDGLVFDRLVAGGEVPRAHVRGLVEAALRGPGDG